MDMSWFRQKRQLDDLRTLVAGLRTDSEDGSTMLLAKRRLDASIEALAESIRAGSELDLSTFAFKPDVSLNSIL